MAKQNKFGTFGGVFVPSILTILGVIMYLRLPNIVGEAGLWATLGIIIVAHIISATTGLSVSSIATDKKVEAGGTYFMISRSLGLPIGGTLGLALFVGLSFSVSLYLIGFSESFLGYWGWSTDINNIRLTGSIMLLIVTTVTFISTSLAIKTQYFIMAAIVLSLLSIFIGRDYVPNPDDLAKATPALSLMALFGIFFPAVTGFEAGVSMSGDLKDPKKSIPSGSIAAIVVGFVVYVLLAIFLYNTVSADALINDKQVLLNIAWIPWLVVIGIWGATLSSALGSILGAPRILQATAVDRISPKFFAKGYGATNEPRNALLFTFLIAEAGILIGELDVIARIVSIFFITTYGFLNISAAFEKWTSTDFRPEFKVSGWISVIGAAACILVMIQLDFVAMLVAVVILGLLFLYLKKKELSLDSGDAWSGVWASLVKKGLTNLKKDKLHNRNWRPNIIMFSGNPGERTHMIEIGKALTGKLGILSAFNLVKSDDRILAKTESNLAAKKETTDYFEHKLYCRDEYEGMDEIARVYGFSGIEPNTIFMGWSRHPSNKQRFIALLESFKHYKYNSIFLNYDQYKKFGNHSSIDIWWSGVGRNLSFAISLMQHIANSAIWKQTKIRLLIINPVNREAENIYKATTSILQNYRVDAEIRLVNNEINPLSESQIISEESKNTDLVIIGISDKKYSRLDHHYDQFSEMLEGIGTTLIVNASGDFDNFEVIPEGKSKNIILPQEAELASLELPALKESKYQEVASDITKVDINGQKVMELFYRKAFQPVISDHLKIVAEISDKTKFVSKELDKITKITDTFRRKKAIDKLKNDFLFKINELYTSQLKETFLPHQLTELQGGIDWYEKRLTSDFEKYPAQLRVEYSKEDFEIREDDRASFKLYKRLKRINHSIFKKPITQNIDYREVARYYQLNNRQVFLNELLQRFEDEVIKFYHDLRRITNDTIAYLDEVERQIWVQSTEWEDKEKLGAIEEAIANEVQNQKDVAKIQLGRLQLEFRKNLQQMSNDLEKVDINYKIKKKSRPAKYYKELVATIQSFPENYDLNVRTLLNMMLMELSVNATKNRIEDIHLEFNQLLKHDVEQKYLKNLDAIEKKVTKDGLNTDFKKLKLDGEFEVSLQQAFVESHERMMTLTEKMPETVEIYSAQNSAQDGHETVVIPVARMAEYYLKSHYEITVEERFETLIESLKRSVYTAKDSLNLTQFNLENEETENKEEREELLKEFLARVAKEKAGVVEKVNDYIQFSDEQFDKAFEPLTSMKIEESAGDLSYDLRNFQGQKVLTGLSHIGEKALGALRNIIIRLFYSRSAGVLFTKKFTRSKELGSFSSRLLDIKETVSPSEQVMKALPPYYVTLFNGKSNISNDFWIHREVEEREFNQAIKRYGQGYTGGILILGDRNSGKTAFCKYVVQRYLKTQVTYTVFPPVQGTSSLEGFVQSLRKATYKSGNVDQIMGQIEERSVLVINDLELFWERGADGLEIIKLIARLIDDYGERVLFVINLNPHAYKLINRMTGFGEKFIENINFGAFDAEGLKDLIMRRHRSSGLAVGLKEGEYDLNEVQQAQLFNNYFSYCEGIPGTALNGWLANIKKVSSKGLIIHKPDYPSLSGLKDLNEDWIMMLTQFVLHKRLGPEKIERITEWESTRVKSLILAMLRAGIIVEKASGIYHIDPYIHPFVVKSLKDKEIL